jgi:benzaldehyde dehydrogenase (NAD)
VALGPVINDKQLQRVKGIVADSVKAGAKIEAGGTSDKLFHQATILSGVKPGMRAFDEETFGPVANIIGFENDEEALELANRHDGALAAAVISRDVGRAMRITDRLNAGMVHVNDQTVNDDANNPFGGPGVAGAGGAVGGPADLDEYTAWQWVTIKDTPPRYPFWNASTRSATGVSSPFSWRDVFCFTSFLRRNRWPRYRLKHWIWKHHAIRKSWCA